MLKKQVLGLLVFGILVSAAFAENPTDLMKRADLLYDGRRELVKCQESLNLYHEILKMDPQNSEAAWKLSRGYYFLGDRISVDKISAYEKGEAAAKRAIAINPKESEAHFWLGVNMGRIGEERGVLNSLFLVQPIKDEMDVVINIDPNYAGADHVLSVLYRKAPGWPISIGDGDKALKYAEKAIALDPDRLLYRVGIAEVYIAQGKKTEAKLILEKVLDMPLEKGYIPEDESAKDTARFILKNL
ncbi:MAG: tetratricopeptide repeat protein [Candidatus Saganbacteria bacterium]|nr:tetratricopeptide repeat protein [Candidatus Saganbacteria bacterium]